MEFVDVPANLDSKVPKYGMFPTNLEVFEYIGHWFNLNALGNHNVMYLLAANMQKTRSYGCTYISLSGIAVFDGRKTSVDQRDDTTAHEACHRFGIAGTISGGHYPHVDAKLGVFSHCAQDKCLMGYYRIRDDDHVELSVGCLLSGSSAGAQDSLRDVQDR